MGQTAEPQSRPAEDAKCLARSVVDALGAEPALEAVTINRARQTISVATLGKTDEPRLVQTVTGRIQKAYEAGPGEHCLLLQGEGDCQTCDTPLSQIERQKITIQHEGDQTTIARVTCPTAPKFWRWRDLPFPKIVPREIEIHEHGVDEWKMQMVA